MSVSVTAPKRDVRTPMLGQRSRFVLGAGAATAVSR